MRNENLAMEIGRFAKSLTGLDLFELVDAAYALLDSQSMNPNLEMELMVKLVLDDLGATTCRS
jgi:hypothetical protein